MAAMTPQSTELPPPPPPAPVARPAPRSSAMWWVALPLVAVVVTMAGGFGVHVLLDDGDGRDAGIHAHLPAAREAVSAFLAAHVPAGDDGPVELDACPISVLGSIRAAYQASDGGQAAQELQVADPGPGGSGIHPAEPPLFPVTLYCDVDIEDRTRASDADLYVWVDQAYPGLDALIASNPEAPGVDVRRAHVHGGLAEAACSTDQDDHAQCAMMWSAGGLVVGWSEYGVHLDDGRTILELDDAFAFLERVVPDVVAQLALLGPATDVDAPGADPGAGDGAPQADGSPAGTYRHAVEGAIVLRLNGLGVIVQDGSEQDVTYRVDGTMITFELAGSDVTQTATLGPDTITFPAGAYSSGGETVFVREGSG